MDENEKLLGHLSEMRALMERSTRFISLSGLSGVFAGIYALVGVSAAFYVMKINPFVKSSYVSWQGSAKILIIQESTVLKLSFVAFAVLFASLLTGYFFTSRIAKKKGQRMWSETSKRMLMHLAIPLATGALFCLVLIWHNIFWLIAPATLIFYGLALISGGKYTLGEIGYLGICQLGLGILAAFFLGYGIIFWAFGFGVLHIIYGAYMYFRYER